MNKSKNQRRVGQVGSQLRNLAKVGSFCGLFLSLVGTGFIWAGVDAFNCSSIIWKASLASNISFFLLTWLIYLPFRNTDKVLGNGLLALIMLFDIFWLFGFAGFYFYFLFAPIGALPRAIALAGFTTMLLYRAYIIINDIQDAFRRNKDLFDRMYCDEGTSIAFKREAVGLLENARRDRNPFKSLHAYAAMIVAPFVLALNRILSPAFGEGHGIYLVVAFFTAPILLWGTGIFVQTVIIMIYYPMKLQRKTGKPVLLKDW
jgi:hypothetical protein